VFPSAFEGEPQLDTLAKSAIGNNDYFLDIRPLAHAGESREMQENTGLDGY
jgi:hypothetical protein